MNTALFLLAHSAYNLLLLLLQLLLLLLLHVMSRDTHTSIIVALKNRVHNKLISKERTQLTYLP
jgi:hypothetical protein